MTTETMVQVTSDPCEPVDQFIKRSVFLCSHFLLVGGVDFWL